MKFVVDTSILIDYLRGGIKWEEFLKIQDQGIELYIPTIVIFELFSSSSTKELKASKKVEDIINYLQGIELTESIARRAGEIYRDVSHKLEVPDYIIAASALGIGGTIVTLNRKHFEQIPGLDIYQ